MENIHNFGDFILEKRIAQISSTIDITFGFDIIKTSHAEDRSDFSKRNLEGDNQNNISNSEMKEFVSSFRKEIATSIAEGDILNDTNFVLKSLSKELAMVIVANKVSDTYWKLIIKTVFRESDQNSLRVSSNQLVFSK